MGHGVAQGQAHVDRVTRRAAVAPGKVQRGCKYIGQAAKVGAGGGTFQAQQGGQRRQRSGVLGADAQLRPDGVERLQRVKQRFTGVWPGSLQREQGAALTADFAAHQGQCPLAAGAVVHDALGLGQAHGGIVVLAAQHQGDPARAAWAHQGGGHASFSQLHEHAGVEPGLRAVDNAAVKQLDGYGAAAGASLIKGQGFALGFDLELGAVK